MKRLISILVAILALNTTLMAQHTFGVSAGVGTATARFYPVEESAMITGCTNFGFSWRYYGEQSTIGCVGIDLEYMQRGYSYVPYASIYDEGEQMLYYTREINSIMVPIVWQPHFYLFSRKVRIFFDAAATFSYNLGSSYTNEFAREAGEEDWQGTYEYKITRDNRWGYGLMGGTGIALLVKRYELFARLRYYFGYSDILRNRNEYSDNYVDGSENPFGSTPLRSPLDNMSISFGVNYRINNRDFDTWNKPKRKKQYELNDGFNYDKK